MTIQQKPIIHGRDHLPGHPDPIPGLLLSPSGLISDAILGTIPGAYYKLNETGTDDWADSSGSGLDATYRSRTGEIRGVDSDLDEADGSLCVTVDGPTPAAGLSQSNIGDATDNFFQMAGTASMSVTARVRPAALPAGSFSMGLCGNVEIGSGASNGWGLYILAAGLDLGGTCPAGAACFRRRDGSVANNEVVSAAALTVDQWVRITATFDGTTLSLYLDSTLVDTSAPTVASLPATSLTDTFYMGNCGIGEGVGGNWAPYDGELDSVAVWDRCLDASEVGGIARFDISPGGALEKYVLTSDGAGNADWEAPTLEVEF